MDAAVGTRTDIVPVPTRKHSGVHATELVARFGSFLMAAPGPIEAPAVDAIKKVLTEISADSRVVSVKAPKFEEAWCSSGLLYPSPPYEERISTWHHHLHWLRFSHPMSFCVEVPEKNQRRWVEKDTLPTSYEVWWDGVVVLTSWRIAAGKPLGLSGGHVVEDILGEALARAGFELYAQSCSPGCSYGYAHTSLRLLSAPIGQEEIDYIDGKYAGEVIARVPGRQSDMVGDVYRDLQVSAHEFTKVKNVGRHILDIEGNARSYLDRLLTLRRSFKMPGGVASRGCCRRV
jgi:hypothetical protein